MAMRMMARRLVNPTGEVLLARSGMRRGMSGNGRIFGEEEKAAENIYIKKVEQERLEKLLRKGIPAEEAKAAIRGDPSAPPEAVKAAKASTDKDTNYAVIAGIVGAIAIGYWYFSSRSSPKKDKEDKE